MKTRKPTDAVKKFKRHGHKELTPKECCALVSWQLERIYEWEMMIWDRIWGTGGGGTPPPPPKWPP